MTTDPDAAMRAVDRALLRSRNWLITRKDRTTVSRKQLEQLGLNNNDLDRRMRLIHFWMTRGVGITRRGEVQERSASRLTPNEAVVYAMRRSGLTCGQVSDILRISKGHVSVIDGRAQKKTDDAKRLWALRLVLDDPNGDVAQEMLGETRQGPPVNSFAASSTNLY